ncbi:MAG: hypothetical protein IKJ07_07840 [Clostridia bacterium]|nr:hypothetical protein [Clostridia bacterium]
MSKISVFIKRKIFDFIVIFALVVSAVLTVFRYRISVVRLVMAIKDFGISVAYYFCAFFDVPIKVTVTELPDASVLQLLPYDVNEIIRKLGAMWSCVFKGDCFVSYLKSLSSFLNTISILLLPLVTFCILAPIIIKSILLTPNSDKHGEKSRMVHFFEQKVVSRVPPIKTWFKTLFSALWDRKAYRWIFLILWLVNFNVLTIAFEILAYYFYFAFSIDLLNLPIQLVKLLLDLIIMLSSAPTLFWIVIAYVIICIVRKNVGYQRLEYRERLDRSTIERLPIIYMFTGTMGTGKTTALTSFGMSTAIMFRNKALELMMEIDSKYPNFPWINFEDELRRAVEYRQILNLITARDFVRKKHGRYSNNVLPSKIFGYDTDLYRYEYDDNLTCAEIWSALEDYARLYFIYIIESSLLVANYSVRVDDVLCSEGNFPLWDSELFRNSPRVSALRSRRSHILDYDILRVARQVLEDNVNSGSFEFGIVLLSEFGKERGNKVTLEGTKKNDDSTNQKNDQLEYSVKMARHKATVCGYAFIRFVADEQRPDSLGADLRQLMNVVQIDEKRPTELLMPMYFIEELIHDLIYPRFVDFYTQYRYARGDTEICMWILHNLMSSFHNQYRRAYNLFGCNVLDVSLYDGKMELAPKKERLHILHKKVYSDRFATDCHGGFFEDELRHAKVGLDDYPEYQGTQATLEELELQNSYFIADMQKVNLKGK